MTTVAGDPTPTETSLIPNPSYVYTTWWPAILYNPDTEETLRDIKIYATNTGLYAYKKRPKNGDTPDYYWPIDYTATPKPGLARNGITITLQDGKTLIITASGGCGCSHPLKGWNPAYAIKTAPWPTHDH